MFDGSPPAASCASASQPLWPQVWDGGHKGSALALMVELLAGPLVGAAVADKLEEKNCGNLAIAIDPALLQVRGAPLCCKASGDCETFADAML